MEFDISDSTTAEQLKLLIKTSNSILNSLPGSNSSAGGTTTTTDVVVGLGNLHAHQLVSTNSFELNGGGGTSISEDSGLPYTNSSVSSGDSIRCVGMCKLELEMTESDGEVSQFDSLDNCSDGGMSAENFNTLKKGPLAPIDPPPQFQDSPQSTLLRSPQLQTFAARITRSLIKNSLRAFIGQHHQRSYDLSPDPILLTERLVSLSTHQLHTARRGEMRHHSSAQELSSGIPFEYLTVATDEEEDDAENIYDVPTMDEEPKPPATTRPSFATLPVSCSIASVKPLQPSCEIYDYDIYYSKKTDTINTTTTTSSSHNTNTNSTSSSSKKHYLDTIQRKKTTLYSPRHYHPGGSNLSTGNRPNSRNSLNSRLSSSHNSLSVPTSNKADDSIFITQAMSHDTLTGREISDFYNVPIDSDMYSLPVDVVVVGLPVPPRSPKPLQPSQPSVGYKNLRSKLKSQRQQKKRRKHCISSSVATDEFTVATEFKYSAPNSKMKMRSTAEAKRYSVPENSIEPMHMSLDEVKRVYHSLYSSSSDGSASDVIIVPASTNNAKAVPPKKAPQSSLVSTPSSGNSNHNNNNIAIVTPPALDASAKPSVGVATKSSSGPSPAKKKAIKSGANNNTTKPVNLKNRKASIKDNEFSTANNNNNTTPSTTGQPTTTEKYGCGGKKSQFSINLNLKQKFCSIFRFRRSANAHITSSGCSATTTTTAGDGGAAFAGRGGSDEYVHTSRLNGGGGGAEGRSSRIGKPNKNAKFLSRALPPLPNKNQPPEELAMAVAAEDQILASGRTDEKKTEDSTMDFAANIEKVKEYGWYWGPISSEAAEKILSNEPDGSFIVRDSSDDHYIFSLTFKLNNSVRHVRIEQDQGTFSFGSCAKFKSHTIMEFIENAVESSRSGRYLFFFHRRPEHGPMRVQLTNPVSRFKHIQSLQHMCRFVIRKIVVRKDLIQSLPLPRRLHDYLGYKNCFSEHLESDSSQTADEEEPPTAPTPIIVDNNTVVASPVDTMNHQLL